MYILHRRVCKKVRVKGDSQNATSGRLLLADRCLILGDILENSAGQFSSAKNSLLLCVKLFSQ